MTTEQLIDASATTIGADSRSGPAEPGAGADHAARAGEGDAVALVRTLLAAVDPERAEHDRLVAQACEVVERVLPAEDCWLVEPGALSRLACQASLGRSAWLVSLSDLNGRATGYHVGVLALARVPVAGEEATLVAWRRTGWDGPSLYQLAGVASLLGEAMTRSARGQLSAVQRARAEYDALRRDLMRTINHELRTPLTAVHGALELLATTDDPEMRRRLARAAEQGVQRLLRLAEAVTERGAGEVHFAGEVRADVVDVVTSCIAGWEQRAGDRVFVTTPVLPGTSIAVRMDADDLREVLDRIVGNAVKFSDRMVAIQLAPVGLGTVGAAAVRTVTITVRDQGMGIPEDEQHLAGTRFFKASNARAREVQGPGLGLAGAMELVRAWGGEVSIASAPGEGTAVTLSLPMAAPFHQASRP